MTPLQSVMAYMRNLNTHTAYAGLRARRAELRAKGKRITSKEAGARHSGAANERPFVDIVSSPATGAKSQCNPVDFRHLVGMGRAICCPTACPSTGSRQPRCRSSFRSTDREPIILAFEEVADEPGAWVHLGQTARVEDHPRDAAVAGHGPPPNRHRPQRRHSEAS